MPQFRIETDQGNFLIDADSAPTEEEAQSAIQQLRSSGQRAAGTLAIVPPQPVEKPLSQQIAEGAVRVGGTVLGGAIGEVLMPAGGAIPGAMAGAGLTDAAVRAVMGEPQSLPESTTQAALAGIPATTLGRAASGAATLAGRVGLGAAEGVAQGVIQTTAHDLLTLRGPPSLPEVTSGAVVGGVLGAGAHGLIGRTRGPQTPNEAIEHAAGHPIAGETVPGLGPLGQETPTPVPPEVAISFQAIPAEQPEVAIPETPAAVALAPSYGFTDVTGMSPQQLRAAADIAKAYETSAAVEVFGVEGAARYERLQRRANSSTALPAAIDEASREIATMEAGLSSAAEQRLFGVGETGYNAEELGRFARAADSYTPEQLADQSDSYLQNTVGRELLERDPTQDPEAAIRLNGALTELARRGFSRDVILEAIRSRAQRSGYSPADTEEILQTKLTALRAAQLSPEPAPPPDDPFNLNALRQRHFMLRAQLPEDVRDQIDAIGQNTNIVALSNGASKDEAAAAALSEAARQMDSYFRQQSLTSPEGPLHPRMELTHEAAPGLVRIDVQGKGPQLRMVPPGGRPPESGGIPPEQPAPAARIARMIERVDAEYPHASQAERDLLKETIRTNADALAAQTNNVQPIARIQGQAAEITIDPAEVVTPGTAENAPHVSAQLAVSQAALKRVLDLGNQVKADPENAELQGAFQQAYAEMVNAHAVFKGYVSEAARTLGVESHRQAPVISPEAAQLGRELVQLPETIRGGGDIPPFPTFRGAAGEQVPLPVGDQPALTPAARMAEYTRVATTMRPGITPEEIQSTIDLAGTNPNRIYRALQDLARPTYRQYFRGLILSNFLTGISPLERNGFGNLIRNVLDVASKPFTAGVDVVRATLTRGKRQTYFREAPAMVAGGMKAVPQALRAWFQIMRQGFTNDDALKLVIGEGLKGEKLYGPAPRLFMPFSRMLDGADAFARLLAAGMHRDARVLSDAITIGTPLGWTRAQIATDAAERALNPDAAALKEITTWASRSIYRENENSGRGSLIDLMRGISNWDPWDLPFTLTPLNLMRQGFQLTPVGFVMKGARSFFTQGATRENTQRVAEAALGTLMIGGLVAWARRGNLRGTAPREVGARDAFLREGPENAIRFPGDPRWHRTSDLGPLNVPVSMAANFTQEFMAKGATPTPQDAVGLATRVSIALAKTGSSLFQMSMFTGIADLIEAASDSTGGAWRRYLQKRAVSNIPFQGVGRQIVNVMDPIQRRPTTLLEQAQTLIPGQSTKVPARLDAFGRPMQKETSGAASLNILSPLRMRPNDTVDAALRAAGIAPAPAKVRTDVTINGQSIPITPQQDFAIRQAKGWLRYAELKRAIATPFFAKASTVARTKVLHDALTSEQSKMMDRTKNLIRSGRPFTAETLVPPFVRAPE